MLRALRMYGPELFLGLIAVFFAFRELGSFPATWSDEGLFIILARSVAEGRGYTMPTMSFLWPYPNIVTSGPPLVLPVALFIKLFGFSLTIARIPMALYILASSVLVYIYTRRISGVSNARWALALLITLSAFINTGKPVLGEVPGFFFFVLGLLLLQSRKPILSGIAFGVCVVAKLTFGLLYPAFGIAWLFTLWKKHWGELRLVTIILVVSIASFLAWPLLMTMHGDLAKEVHQSVLGEGGQHFLYPLKHHAKDFLRFQFVYFYLIFGLSLLGMYRLRHQLGVMTVVYIVSFALLNVLHVLSVPFAPWYRYVLPAHLALLPFVPAGVRSFPVKHLGTAVLTVFVAAQFFWQLTYQGSHKSDEELQTARILMEEYFDTDLVIAEAEIFALLPQQHPRWYFVTKELERRTYDVFDDVPTAPDEHCLPVLRKIARSDQETMGSRVTPIYWRFALVAPPESCN